MRRGRSKTAGRGKRRRAKVASCQGITINAGFVPKKAGRVIKTRPAFQYLQTKLRCLFLGLELALQPRLAVDVVEGLQDLELAVGLGLADVDVLGQVHVLLRGDRAARAGEGEAALQRDADLVDVE